MDIHHLDIVVVGETAYKELQGPNSADLDKDGRISGPELKAYAQTKSQDPNYDKGFSPNPLGPYLDAVLGDWFGFDRHVGERTHCIEYFTALPPLRVLPKERYEPITPSASTPYEVFLAGAASNSLSIPAEWRLVGIPEFIHYHTNASTRSAEQAVQSSYWGVKLAFAVGGEAQASQRLLILEPQNGFELRQENKRLVSLDMARIKRDHELSDKYGVTFTYEPPHKGRERIRVAYQDKFSFVLTAVGAQFSREELDGQMNLGLREVLVQRVSLGKNVKEFLSFHKDRVAYDAKTGMVRVKLNGVSENYSVIGNDAESYRLVSVERTQRPHELKITTTTLQDGEVSTVLFDLDFGVSVLNP